MKLPKKIQENDMELRLLEDVDGVSLSNLSELSQDDEDLSGSTKREPRRKFMGTGKFYMLRFTIRYS